MRLAPTFFLILVAWLCAGCGITDIKARNTQADQYLQNDSEERKARLKASSSLSPQEYAALAKQMGWTEKSAGGLPPPPTTEELEQRIREAGKQP